MSESTARDEVYRLLAEQLTAQKKQGNWDQSGQQVLLPGMPTDNDEIQGISATGREASLALAIYRTTIQRWLTLRAIVQMKLTQPIDRLEPKMQSVLLAGAAQLIFMTQLPDYAVVNESVRWTRRAIRPKAGGLVNAVLRKVAQMVAKREGERSWCWDEFKADPTTLFDGHQGVITLTEPLCDMTDTSTSQALAIATSHPVSLVDSWLALFDEDQTVALLLHSLVTPPISVYVETASSVEIDPEVVDWLTPLDEASDHNAPNDGPIGRSGHWTGTYGQLKDALAEHANAWVQDVTSTRAVGLTDGLPCRRILDLCAGRGTKTRQLAMHHSMAEIIGTDCHGGRLNDLRQWASDYALVRPVNFKALDQTIPEFAPDLIVLDVPCSNSGVLARRLEARYRYDQTMLTDVIALQREIAERAIAWLTPSTDELAQGGMPETTDRVEGGRWLLYSTCSIEPCENRAQIDWMIDRFGLTLISEKTTLPKRWRVEDDSASGPLSSNEKEDHASRWHYQDGGYAALLKMP